MKMCNQLPIRPSHPTRRLLICTHFRAPFQVPRVEHDQVRGPPVPVVHVQEQVAVVLTPRSALHARHKDGLGREAPLGKRGRVRLKAPAGGQVDLCVL